MHESPRIRRLRNDLVALDRLSSESSVFQFKATGSPPNHYQITFLGKGLCRDRGKIKLVHLHRIEIKLGASYPRTIPEIRWLTPVYHPNISEIGMVCLGGYGTHWVPSVQLDELCMMLWDMTRYHNYDIRSPYNREAALWVANQTSILFPTDSRPLRDLRVAQGRVEPPFMEAKGNGKPTGTGGDHPATSLGDGRLEPRKKDQGAEARTVLDRVRLLMEQRRGNRQSVPTRTDPAPQARALEPEPVPEPATCTPAVAEAAVNESSGDDVLSLLARLEESSRNDQDVVILENWEESPANPPGRVSRGEDILFIE
jgi:ubiquitin-protein ligase